MVRDRSADRQSERRGATSLSEMILSAVAEREGVDVDELKEPLYESIDPDALEKLFRDSTGQVTFEYLGYEVTVDHERIVEVTGTGSR